MNNKFTEFPSNSLQTNVESNKVWNEEGEPSLNDVFNTEERLHFSPEELRRSRLNTPLLKIIKSILLTVVLTGLTYGSAHFFHDNGFAKEIAALFVLPLSGAAGIMGTKSLNNLMGYIVAKLQGYDYVDEIHLNSGNASADFVRRVENKFDKEYIDRMTFINEEESRRR